MPRTFARAVCGGKWSFDLCARLRTTAAAIRLIKVFARFNKLCTVRIGRFTLIILFQVFVCVCV